MIPPASTASVCVSTISGDYEEIKKPDLKWIRVNRQPSHIPLSYSSVWDLLGTMLNEFVVCLSHKPISYLDDQLSEEGAHTPPRVHTHTRTHSFTHTYIDRHVHIHTHTHIISHSLTHIHRFTQTLSHTNTFNIHLHSAQVSTLI